MSKIKGRLVTDYLAGVASSSIPSKVKTKKGIACQAVFRANQALIRYGDGENLHRPYMYITGVVTQLTGEFPCGVDTIELGTPDNVEDMGPKVSYQLEFSQKELSVLCEKGLFTAEFVCPDIFIDNDFEMPLKCDCIYIESEDEDDAPLLFVSIQNQYGVRMPALDTGYDLTSYFDNFVSENEAENEAVVEDEDVVSADYSSDDFLFADDAEANKDEAESDIEQESEDEDEDDFDAEPDPMDVHYENIQKSVDRKLQEKQKREDEKATEKAEKRAEKKKTAKSTHTSKKSAVPTHIEDIEKEHDKQVREKDRGDVVFVDDGEEFI